jgi:hypothetical protein
MEIHRQQPSADRTWHRLDASHMIPTHVLCFEVSGLHHRTLVRLVHLTGQTSLMLLHLRLRSWICGSTKEPSGFLVNHWKPRELGVPSTNHTLKVAHTKSWLNLCFEAQSRNHP